MMRARTLIWGVGVLVIGAGLAAADEGAAPPDADPTPPGLAPADAADPDAAPAPSATIAVTGSLIERASRVTPSALTILTRDELVASGRTMVGDILQSLPEQGNALNAQANNGGDGSTRLDLRSLGPDRTLVLLNGRRFVAVGTGADSTVDLNTIPLAVIDRVEILNDGASAVYGSSAIGGVVNLITRTDFTGTEASLYTGHSQRADGFTYDASFITGHHTESHHGNIIFSAGIQSQDPVFAGDRAFSNADKNFDFATGEVTKGGSSATPAGQINATEIDLDGDGVGDEVNLCGAGEPICTRGRDGGFRPFVTPDDLYNFQPANYLYTPSSRFNAYTAGNYQLLPTASAFFESSYMHRESDQQLAPEPFLARAPISRDSLYNPFGGDVLGYSRRLEELGPRDSHQSISTFRTLVGLKGGIPDDVAALRGWTWELSYSYGRTDSTQHNTGNLILSHLRSAIGPSFVDGSGVPTCGTMASPILGCVPMDILGPSGSISQAAAAYTAFTGVTSGLDQQHMVLATAHGRLFQLPHRGDVSAAISTDFRKESGELTPDPLIASGDTTGNLIPAVRGSNSVLEAAAEVSAVPVRDADGLERLELDVAARVFRYDDFGGFTSSTRALVRPLRGVTVRASYAAGFRAPTLAEQFQQAGEAFGFAADPCDHAFGGTPSNPAECAFEGVPPDAEFGDTQHRLVTRGNPNVGPERATILTAGAVVEPAVLPGLALSLAYWAIDVTHAIQQPSLQAIFEGCYGRGDRAFCDLIHRDPSRGGGISFIDDPSTNLGGTATRGIDAAVGYDRDVRGAGKLHVRAEAQRLLRYQVDTGGAVLDGLGNFDLGVHPKLRASLAASWQHPGGAGAGFNVHVVGGFLECENVDCNGGAPSREVEPYAKLDVFGSYALRSARGQTLITLGVNNVFDRDPALIYSGQSGDSDAATYDFLGRFFYARVTQLF